MERPRSDCPRIGTGSNVAACTLVESVPCLGLPLLISFDLVQHEFDRRLPILSFLDRAQIRISGLET
jgi:hypothetical protein